METGHVVRFATQKHPFLIEARPCLELDCPCSVVLLTFSELAPPVSAPRDRLVFTLRVCLRTWLEQDPPPRSLEVKSLVQEFLARFPNDRIDELMDQFQRTRASERRLSSLKLSGSRDELVSYSSVVDERGGICDGFTDHAYFYLFEGREYLVEDHYCANPECDCHHVHLEFWERVRDASVEGELRIRQQIMATFTLAGKLVGVRCSQEFASTTRNLLDDWLCRCGSYFGECRRRYALIKAVGARSFPAESTPAAPVVVARETRRAESTFAAEGTRRHVGRNDPCPCGSGLKFKRCCARRASVTD